jgi:hypothetical protein
MDTTLKCQLQYQAPDLKVQMTSLFMCNVKRAFAVTAMVTRFGNEVSYHKPRPPLCLPLPEIFYWKHLGG